ncbi:site-2 protease family protein [Aestuariivirga sp.]|uniref:site-2 protease family protein n=1 Tax=Aestuariivirga sp. TaxID=2650926 RepID=UPI0039E31610
MLRLLILLLTTAKFGKLLLSAGSMLLTIWVYTTIYGLPFAAGFVGLLLVHEMGHYFAAQQRGLSVSLPAFIPFMGAFINLREQPHDSETEAYVAYAGPFTGTLGAFAVYFWGRHTDTDFWMALAYAGFVLNLFNLIPVSPLDGGRITQVLSPRIWLLGAPMLAIIFYYMPSPMLVLIGVLALPSLFAAWRYDPASPEAQAYRSIDPGMRFEYMVLYLGLVAVTALMAFHTHEGLAHR